jgi:hypothetical protein
LSDKRTAAYSDSCSLGKIHAAAAEADAQVLTGHGHGHCHRRARRLER